MQFGAFGLLVIFLRAQPCTWPVNYVKKLNNHSPNIISSGELKEQLRRITEIRYWLYFACKNYFLLLNRHTQATLVSSPKYAKMDSS